MSRSCVVGDKAINPDAIDNVVNAFFALLSKQSMRGIIIIIKSVMVYYDISGTARGNNYRGVQAEP